MKLKKKIKAFTLTELLVVVVVIGVLSAVVLPKYSKVIETRRTTEAEELMGAIRTEQEKRCALDKEYLMKFDGLKDIVKNPDTKNYKLALASTGINATRNDKYSYTLEMPSYADGRICCSGADCEKLNKNYPACDELKSKGDYQSSPENCAGGEEPVTPPTPCNNCGCPEYAAAHMEECNPGKLKPCDMATKPAESQSCNGCGKQTRSVTCNTVTSQWDTGSWDECSKTEAECQDVDCCEYANSMSEEEFSKCLLDKYNYSKDSPEYICSIGGGTNNFYDKLGCASGAVLCAYNNSLPIVQIGSNSKTGVKWSKIKDSVSSVWVVSGYKRWACDKTIPCNQSSKPSSTSPCNGCGERSAIYECDTTRGSWVISSHTECSKTETECSTGCTAGERRTKRDESACGWTVQKQICQKASWTDSEGYYNNYWQNDGNPTYEVKEGAECMYGQTKSGYYCDLSTCKWVKSSGSGGGGGGSSSGGGGGGGGTDCHRFTDMYSGSFCQVCKGFGISYCW